MADPVAPAASSAKQRRPKWELFLVRGSIVALLLLVGFEAFALYGYTTTMSRLETRLDDEERQGSVSASDLRRLAVGWFKYTDLPGAQLVRLQWPSLFKTYVLKVQLDDQGDILAFTTDDASADSATPAVKVNPVTIPVVQVTADVFTLQKPVGGDRILAREIVRQALFAAAREQLSLPTCDPVLGESLPVGQTGTLWPLRVEVDTFAETAESSSANVMVVQITPSKQLPLLQETVKAPKGLLIVELTRRADQWSTNEFAKILKQAGYQPRPHPGPAENKPAELLTSPDELAARLDLISQFAAQRIWNERLSTGDDTLAVRGGLARSAALLGTLLEPHWNVSHKVFKARSLVMADAVTRKWPDDPMAWWTRAYVRALCGLHQPAVEDIDRAKTLAGNEPPSWAAAIESFSRWDTKSLLTLTAEESELSAYLWMLAMEIAGTEAERIAAARLLWGPDRRCLRAAAALVREKPIGLHHEVCNAQMREFDDVLPRLLSAVPGRPEALQALLANRPKKPAARPRIANPLLQQFFQNAEDQGAHGPSWRAQVVEVLLNIEDRTIDRQEPSWQTLGHLIDDMAFFQATALLDFHRHKLGVETTDDLAELRPHFTKHPLATLLEGYSSDPKQAQAAMAALPPILQQHEFSDGAMQLYSLLYRSRMPDEIWPRILAQRDSVVTDLAISYRNYIAQPVGAPFHFAPLQRLAPDCPVVAAINAASDWATVEPQARQWEEKYADYPEVIKNLARQYQQANRLDDAERCWKRLTEISPEPASFRSLADLYKSQEKWDEWKVAMHAIVERPSLGLEQAGAARTLAEWYYDRNDWETARPYADLAAQSYSAWGLICGAECYEGLRDWRKAEALWKANSHRYEGEKIEWYFWCKRTGHGDVAAARTLAEQKLSKEAVGTNAELRLQRAVLLELDGNLDGAYSAYEELNTAAPNDYYRWLLVSAAHRLDRIADRNRWLDEIAKGEYDDCERFLARSLQQVLAGRHPAADDTELDWYLSMRLDAGMVTNNLYFIAQYLLLAGETERALPWLERCASSPRRNKRVVALAGNELIRRGRESPVRRGTEHRAELQSAITLLLEGFKFAEDQEKTKAIERYRAAQAAAPEWLYPHYALAIGLRNLAFKGMSTSSSGQPTATWDESLLAEAEPEWTRLIERLPGVPDLYNYRGKVREDQHNYRGAIEDYETGLKIDPDSKPLHNNYGWLLAACADDEIRNGIAALDHAQRAVGRPAEWRHVELALLAAASAENSEFAKAVDLQQQAIAAAPQNDQWTLRGRLKLYQEQKPYRRAGRPKQP